MKKIHIHPSIPSALKKINNDLKVSISIKDILDIEKNIAIFDREKIYIGKEIASTFYFIYKEEYFGFYSKKNIAEQIRRVFRDLYISGEVSVESIVFSDNAQEENIIKDVFRYLDEKMDYSFNEYYLYRPKTQFVSRSIDEVLLEMQNEIVEANEFLEGREQHLDEIIRDNFFNDFEKMILTKILKNYSGEDKIRKGVAIIRDNIPGICPYTYGYPIYTVYDSDPNFTQKRFVTRIGDKITGCILLDLIDNISCSEEKKKILTLIGVKELFRVFPRVMDTSCYRDIISSLCL